MSRRVRLILCSGNGTVLGSLPRFTVDSPWWPDVEPVVETARERFDVEVVVLRLLSTRTESHVMGGDVSYLAEVVGDPPTGIEAWGEGGAVGDHPLRAPWARPGGVAAAVAWADARLAEIRRPRTGPFAQIKTWNLSSILRVPTARGAVWCKSVPPFQDHEGIVLAILGADDPSLVPTVLAANRATGTVLLEDVSGQDQWEASAPVHHEMVRRWVRTQARWVDRTDRLAEARIPDWRADAFRGSVAAMLDRSEVRSSVEASVVAALDGLVADLPRRLSDLDACGVPETIVHGDFHPGNWRADGNSLVLLDWGDAGLGHPMLDLTAFLFRVPEEERDAVLGLWIDAWRDERPGSDPGRAAEVIRPVAALRQALIYRGFLDGIEPGERRYHESDVPFWLRQAAAEAGSPGDVTSGESPDWSPGGRWII